MSNAINEVSSQEFVEWTVRRIRHGDSLAPFIGSGLSAPSGILTGQDFTNFLAWTVYRCVAGEQLAEGGTEKSYHRLRQDGWPDPPNQAQVEEAKLWIFKQFVEVCDQCGVKVNKKDKNTNLKDVVPGSLAELVVTDLEPKDKANDDPLNWKLLRPLVPSILTRTSSDQAIKSDAEIKTMFAGLSRTDALRSPRLRPGQFNTSLAFVCEAAIRALHEWRGTLDFLSRLVVKNNDTDVPLRLVDTPSQAVIDGFNYVITHGRRPNLAHNMICHLAGRARIRVVLTTNFDPLVEEAFADLGQPLDPIPVSTRGELPAVATVLAQNSVVKLHGSLSETRADYSLDDPPPLADLRRFFAYVRGREPGRRADEGHLPAMLIVCGYSGSDLRCLQMIQYVLDADKQAKVLWVCHKKEDIQKLTGLFPSYGEIDKPTEHGEKLHERLDEPGARIVVTATDRCDLLLYDLYQRLTLSLPRGGFNYQFNPNVPPGLDDIGEAALKIPEDPHDLNKIKDYKEHPGGLQPSQKELVCELLKRLLPAPGSKPNDDKIATADGTSGLLAPMRTVFHHMTNGKPRRQGIWLWLGDHADTVSLAHELFTVMALRLGRFQLDHARFSPQNVATALPTKEEWEQHIGRLFEHWGMDPAKWFVVIDGRNGTAGCAGWDGQEWSESTRQLMNFLRGLQAARNAPLATVGKDGVRVLFAPYSKDRRDHLKARWNPTEVGSVQEISKSMLSLPAPRASNEFSERLRRIYADHSGVCVGSPDDAMPQEQDITDSEVQPYLDATPKPIPVAATYEQTLRTALNEWIAPAELCAAGGVGSEPKARARHAFYAASLFRQSRHFSAFISEGVAPCPRRYNSCQQDNDWERYSDVKGWLDDWKKQGIFYEKTGGFAWMYRDLRLGIRHILEKSVQPVLLAFDQREIWLQSAVERRARIHFWIGDWYTRAFRATGHAEPLLEALYHYGQCVLYSPLVRLGADVKNQESETVERDRIQSYRQRYARRALFEIIKTLRLGRREIKFWIQAPAGETWFGSRQDPNDHRHIVTKFEKVFGKLFDATEPWESWLRQFEAELSQHPHVENRPQVTFFRLDALIEDLSSDSGAPLIMSRPSVLCQPENWWQVLKDKVADSQSAVWQSITSTDQHAVNQLVADLFIQLENHRASLKADKDAALQFNKGCKLAAVKAGDIFRARPQALYTFIQLLMEMAYATVQCAKRLEHCNGSSGRQLVPGNDVCRLWVEICALCWLSLDLCLELPPSEMSADCRLRIFAGTLYGLALGRLGRFFEAHRRLNEAHGWLSKTEVKLAPLETAIIEIRRAEVHLLEAVRLKIILEKYDAFLKKKHGLSIETFLDSLTKETLPVPVETVVQWKQMYLGGLDLKAADPTEIRQRLIRIHLSKLDDAWLALEPAETALSGKTHSTLWWGQLHTLKMRIYAEHWWPSDDADPIRPHRALMFRERRNYQGLITDLYRAARITYHLDPYHELRLIWYATNAFETVLNRHFFDEQGFTTFGSARQNGSADFWKAMKFDEVLCNDFDSFKKAWEHRENDGLNNLLQAFYQRIKELIFPRKCGHVGVRV